MKNLSLRSNFFSYLVWLAPLLITAGLVAGFLTEQWTPVPAGLIIAGGVMFLAWLLWRSLPGMLGRRSTQAGTNAVVATLAVLVILGLINFLAVRYVQRVDLTENQLFTLSPQTQEVLADLEQPAKVWVFWDGQASPHPADRELLENYERESDQFSYEFVDPREQPGLANEFGVQTLGDVFVEIGDARRPVQTIDPQQRLSERQLTNALAQTTSDRQRIAYFVQGHGERPLEAGQGGLADVQQLLEGENVQVVPLNLAEAASVPEDADVVILAGPRRSLLEGEVQALQAYSQTEGGVLLLVDPNTDPGLTPLLEDWGVQLSNLLVIDPAGEALGLGFTTPLIQSYGDHPITEEFGQGISFFPESQIVEIEPQEGTETAPLIITSAEAQAVEIPESGEIQLGEQPAVEGPLVLGVALSRPVDADTADAPAETPDAAPEDAADEAPPEARMVVIGNSSFIVNGLVNQQLNGDVFLNAIAWLSQDDDQTLAIRPKEPTDRRLVLNTQQWILISLTAAVLLPLIGFGAAIAVWLKRR